jgi:hypothetical protein
MRAGTNAFVQARREERHRVRLQRGDLYEFVKEPCWKWEWDQICQGNIPTQEELVELIECLEYPPPTLPEVTEWVRGRLVGRIRPPRGRPRKKERGFGPILLSSEPEPWEWWVLRVYRWHRVFRERPSCVKRLNLGPGRPLEMAVAKVAEECGRSEATVQSWLYPAGSDFDSAWARKRARFLRDRVARAPHGSEIRGSVKRHLRPASPELIPSTETRTP